MLLSLGSVDEYISETRKLKDIIRRLKSDFADRKELILRMEMIKQGIDNGWHLDDIGGNIFETSYFIRVISPICPKPFSVQFTCPYF
jgi:hypothetical protein